MHFHDYSSGNRYFAAGYASGRLRVLCSADYAKTSELKEYAR
jgi:hypothetical protein